MKKSSILSSNDFGLDISRAASHVFKAVVLEPERCYRWDGGGKEIAHIKNCETKVVPGVGLRWRAENFMHLSQNFSVNFPKSAENKEDIAIIVSGIIPFSFNEITAQIDFQLLLRYLIYFQMTISVFFSFRVESDGECTWDSILSFKCKTAGENKQPLK